MKIRLIGTPDEVLIALCRMRQSFSQVTHGDPVQCRRKPGHVILYLTVKF